MLRTTRGRKAALLGHYVVWWLMRISPSLTGFQRPLVGWLNDCALCFPEISEGCKVAREDASLKHAHAIGNLA